MAFAPSEFWEPYEATVASFDDAHEMITDVVKKWSAKGSVFVWRGQVDASWALHSSLYRRKLWSGPKDGDAPTEQVLQEEEQEILREVHRWGLHSGSTGRLSILAQLALLQHYGAPTRLIDVTSNPLIALWFAVELQWDDGVARPDDIDGRLFAIDVSNRRINEMDSHRKWEDSLRRPWPRTGDTAYKEWTTSGYTWRPARLDHRMSAQHGEFLLGGVPSTGTSNEPVQWVKDTAKKPSSTWKIDEVRRAVSVPIHFHKIAASQGHPPSNPAFTIRVASAAKQDIRQRLEKMYGLRHATIYPDFPGFAQFGRPTLRTRPP